MGRLYSLVVLVFALGCQKSSGVANDGQVRPTEFGDGLVIDVFVRVTCKKLNSCFDGPAACESELFKLTNIDAEIGISPGGFKNLLDMRNAEQSGDLKPNSGSRLCFEAIEDLSC